MNSIYNEVRYIVRWIDGFNNGVVKEEYVLHGRSATPPDDSILQIHTDENNRKWKFNGYYDPDNYDSITSNIDITLTYEELYKLEIKYIKEGESQAFDSIVAYYFAGETFSYKSPIVDGYIVDQEFVRGDMPPRDVECIIRYQSEHPKPSESIGKIKMTSSVPGADYTFGYFPNGSQESYMRPDIISVNSVQEKISHMLFILNSDDLVFGIAFENTSIDLSDFIGSEVYIKVGAVYTSGTYMAIAGNSISWLLNRGGGTQSLFDQFLRQCGAEYDYTLTITPQTISTP